MDTWVNLVDLSDIFETLVCEIKKELGRDIFGSHNKITVFRNDLHYHCHLWLLELIC